LDEPLSAALKANPAAKTLEDLILTIQGTDHFDLKAFRQFLRNAGHPSHPPYRGRYPRTLPAVYLETTGCDMAAAMKSGFFAGAAPAALYYFGPTHEELRKQASQVYETLGLGLPSMRNQEAGRTGCKKILEVEALKKGWSDLVQSINKIRQQALTANDPKVLREHCNRWMELLCTAFVIQTAHRATRLECLTAGALCLHHDVLLIRDKDEGDRAQPRLVPNTAAAQQILKSAAECHSLMTGSQEGTKDGKTPLFEATDLVFCQWGAEGEREAPHAIKTGAIDTTARKFFCSEANFGRSNWVTHLHEDRCNRWLIRSLTGHTRDVTRTHGAYFDVPPLVVAARLGLQMELTGKRIFGKAEILSDVCEPPGLKLALFKDRSVQSPAKDRVPDPRTILEPMSVDTLVKWCICDRVRNDLLNGRIDAPIEALAVLHLLFIDQIPESGLCISAITDGSKVIKRYGQRAGLNWIRGHFIHPTWLPIQPTSFRLIERITKAGISATDLIKQTCTAVRKQQYCAWPTSDKSCWAVISSMGLSFRRLSFPPSITAVSDRDVPAPCLSALSLSRLAGEKGTPVSRQRPVNAAAYTRQKGEDEKLLTRIIGKYASTTHRLGDKIKRAKNCLQELESCQMNWSPFMRWIKDWVMDELKRTREASPGHYQTSSIDTYRSVLVTASELVPPADDPADWEDPDWMAWVWQTDRLCGGKSNSPAVGTENTLTERTKHAVQALVNSLVRRSIYVPSKLHELLGNSIKTLTPRGSASACLILTENLAESRTVLENWYQDSPGDFAIADLRVTAYEIFPARSGEVSSLKTECLTPSRGLVIERAGYNVHKNDNSIRVIPLSEKDALEFQKKKSAIGLNFGQHDLLTRYDGSHKAGLRDECIIDDWSLALKDVTGDPLARPHSARAATLQNIAWPGWQQQVQDLISNAATPRTCVAWALEQQSDYCRLSTAVSLAGHGDLRPALGNYLAGWSLIYAVNAAATLEGYTPGPIFLEQLGLSRASLRQARSRDQHRSADKEESTPSFDTWLWVTRQLTAKPLTSAKAASDVNEQKAAISEETNAHSPPSPPPSAISELLKIRYLTVRILGLAAERAVEELIIPFRLIADLEKLLPPESLMAAATTRGRAGQSERGRQADIHTALSDAGVQIQSWLGAMDQETHAQLNKAFFRDESYTSHRDEKVGFWQEVIRSFPVNLSLYVNIGSKYLTTSEISALGRLAPALELKSNPRIGEIPAVSLRQRQEEKFNPVVSARLTAVARTCSLAIQSLRSAHWYGGSNAR